MAKAASPRTIWIDLENTPHVPFFVPRSEEHTSELQSPCRSEEHTSELQSPCNLVCRLLLEKKKKTSTRRLDDPPHLSDRYLRTRSRNAETHVHATVALSCACSIWTCST